jgi:ElaB/YqjD/DUF883 family membrane-anchored ribosome-binding protein
MSSFEDRMTALKQSMRDVIDYGSGRAGVLKDRLADVKDSALAGASTAIDRTGKLIRKHPIAAIAIAVAIGFLTVRLLRRK